MERLKIFTWHIHGSYLYYLSQGNIDIYIPVNSQKTEGYIGRGTTFPFGSNVHEIPVGEVRNIAFDCILFQSAKNYNHDQHQIFSDEQRRLPKIFIEHDPPQGHPTDTKHMVKSPDVTLVHVTHFNGMMWDNNGVPTQVIDHGVVAPKLKYSGKIERGIVVINNLHLRGRRLGLDLYQELSKHVPLDLVGMNSHELGGLGEVLHPELPEFVSRYRFFLNPIRYTSLGLAVIEAMMIGVPVVGFATTEMVTVFKNGVNGFIHTDKFELIKEMKGLLNDPALARQIGAEGKKTALERFNITRFVSDWEVLLNRVIGKKAKVKQLISI